MKVGVVAVWAVATVAGPAGAFVSPPVRPTVGARRVQREQDPVVSKAEVSSSQSESLPIKSSSGTSSDMRDQVRDAIWKATDVVTHAVDEMPDLGASSNQTLAMLGQMVEGIDDKLFGEYRPIGATSSYLSSISPNREIADGSAGGKNKKATTSAAKAGFGSAGTVQLDRPKQVQGVFDELQKKAVSAYGSIPADEAALGAEDGNLTEGQKLEAQLESLLDDSEFKPRKLREEKRSQLVDTLKAMEAVYPGDANPVGDPALSGQWSVVYSSSSRMIGRLLRGLLAGLFKVSDASQTVDSKASSVLNACRARLRLTPLALRLSKKGTFKSVTVGGEEEAGTAGRKVVVNFPSRKKSRWSLLGRLLLRLRSGKREVEVTYLSSRWRICRLGGGGGGGGGATVAFRKAG